MLQFIAQTNEKYTIAELSQMAIEGGCQWIVLRVPDMADHEIRELVQELTPLCKETSTILTIENHVELAKELGLHGIWLKGSDHSAHQVREMFGPEAIIGVQVEIASSAMALVGADIDYVSFPPTVPLERISENVEALRNAKFELPIVAEGNFGILEIPAVLATGVNGIAEAEPISSAADPVAETEKIINALNSGAQ
ncbi:MAG: thiamine phosphate synthase [Bacteroidales bacterium]|nr:thiamine phosphate synthase [Bacteroidales bacterium]